MSAISSRDERTEDEATSRRKILRNESHQCMENQGEKMKKQDRSSHGEVSAGDITQTTLRSVGVSKAETNPLTLLFTGKKTNWLITRLK